MPTYSYRCRKCEQVVDAYRRVDDRDLAPTHCGGLTDRQVSAPRLAPMFQEYVSPVSGKRITSRGARSDDLKATNSLPWEPGIKQDIARNRERAIQKSVDLATKRVDETVAALNASGRL